LALGRKWLHGEKKIEKKRKGVGSGVGPKLVRKRKMAQGLFGLYKTFLIFKQIFYFTNFFEFKPNLNFE
jgi:hypothetical protein